jgi:hypothetical protein
VAAPLVVVENAAIISYSAYIVKWQKAKIKNNFKHAKTPILQGRNAPQHPSTHGPG